ncbi:DUF1353 domain-containing protein [Helicobacter bilis]|uniref:DUF1353 domain-containing protein n=1 Tax=Helicobacter bilis TaxID=37372 RepID=A0A4U8UAT5_9HELI|nr:DUF1353 domain-containing protein [Helicobacter bilis]TLE09375.1 DUF1353 domain-containing protein [Helicobacter bilis]TLE11432.1 DUF1353 domain-containing protein [Helicobacter bilis]
MSSFREPLDVRVRDDGRHYEVLDTFTYYLDSNKEALLKVEKGFITDFASVPRIFWSIYPPFGRYTKCAVLHDRLCVAFLNKELWNKVAVDKDKLPIALQNRFVRRCEADKLFLDSMKAIKVNAFTRFVLYASVRVYAIFKYGLKA